MQLLDQPAAICLCPSPWGFDYNKAPLAPPGIHVLAHDKPKECGMLAPHGAEGWYIDAAMDHHRCYTVVVTKMNAT